MEKPAYDPADFMLGLNIAHGTAIDAKNAVRTIANDLRNGIAAEAGRAQGAIAKANRSAQERVAKQAGKAQAAVDDALASMSANIHQTIQSAIVPLVDLGVDLPSSRDISAEKQRLLGLPGPLNIPEGACTRYPHELLEAYRISYTVLVWTSQTGYCCMQQAVVNQLQSFQVKSMAPAIRVVWTFSKWWRAELACRLLTECSILEKDLRPYFDAIDQMQIYSGSGGINPVGLCAGAKQLWPGMSQAINE